MTVATTAAALAVDVRPSVRFPGKYLSVTTFRHAGEPVATPVWFVQVNGLLYVDTDGLSGKAKRIRANPHVFIAPCSASGKLKAPQTAAIAEIIEPSQMPASAREKYARKYRVDRILVLPAYRLLKAVKRGRRHDAQPVVLVITPTGT